MSFYNFFLNNFTTLQFFLLTIKKPWNLEPPHLSTKNTTYFFPNCPTAPRSGSSNNNYDGPSHFAPLWLHWIWTRKNFPVAPHRSSLPGQGAETQQPIRRNAWGNATPWLEGRKLTHKFGEEGSLLRREMFCWNGCRWREPGCCFCSIIGNFGGMEWQGSWIRSDMLSCLQNGKSETWDIYYVLLIFCLFLSHFRESLGIQVSLRILKFRYQNYSNLNYPSKLLRTPKWPKLIITYKVRYNAWWENKSSFNGQRSIYFIDTWSMKGIIETDSIFGGPCKWPCFFLVQMEKIGCSSKSNRSAPGSWYVFVWDPY